MVTFSPGYPDMTNTEPYIGDAEASDAQMKDCVGVIPEDRNPFVQGVDGIPVVQIIEAIFESSQWRKRKDQGTLLLIILQNANRTA